MASAADLPPLATLKSEVQKRVSKALLNDLKAACGSQGLTKSGRKSELMDRVLHRLSILGDQIAVAKLLHNLGGNNYLQQGSTASIPSASANSNASVMQHAWRESPFYKLQKPLALNKLPVFQSHRNTVSASIDWRAQDLEDMRRDSNLRVLLFCGERPSTLGTTVDVAFPQQVEIRIGSQEVKANTRGIKKKPGSTNPVDITGFMRTRSPQSASKVDITYACTDKIYDIAIMLAKNVQMEDLVGQVRSRRFISIDQVLRDMRSKADDDDIVAGPTIMSLKDSVSYVRIADPCRGSQCSHYSCFDLVSYLTMQKQAPLWTCPICDKKAAFDQIVVDQYFEDILTKAPSNVDTVTVQPNGSWSADPPPAKRKRDYDSDDSDDSDSDDLVEISPPDKKQKSARLSISQSATPAPIRQKRQSDVIDLTLSSEDEGPVPPRRQATMSTMQQPSMPPRSSSTATSRSSPYAQPQPRVNGGYSQIPSNTLARPDRPPFTFQLGNQTSSTFAPHSQLSHTTPFFSPSGGPYPGRMLPSPTASPNPYLSNGSRPQSIGSNVRSSMPQFGRPSLEPVWSPAGSSVAGQPATSPSSANPQ
jgi:E3 SUMO-protein ligase PIAS1